MSDKKTDLCEMAETVKNFAKAERGLAQIQNLGKGVKAGCNGCSRTGEFGRRCECGATFMLGVPPGTFNFSRDPVPAPALSLSCNRCKKECAGYPATRVDISCCGACYCPKCKKPKSGENIFCGTCDSL